MKTIRHLHLVGATGTLRSAVYNGVECIVCPVVAMVEGVVWAVNSEYPELVTAEELAKSPQQWNGRACFAGHPEKDGAQITANLPRVLETSFGTVFDTVSSERILVTRRLEFDAYLDPAKAKVVGPEAEDVIRRLKAGKTVEVSVGCYVESKDGEGTWNGKPYVGAWESIVSDHVAFLADGETGACSIEAGCGALRTSVRHLVTAEGIRREEDMSATAQRPPKPTPQPSAEMKKRTIAQRISAFMSSLRDSEGNSDIDVRRALDDALRAIEPGFQGVSEVYPESSEVIYYVMPADEWMMKRRNYTMTDGGVATLTDNAVEVEPVTTYEVVKAASAAPKAACGCGGALNTATSETRVIMREDIKKLVDAGTFTADEAKGLESLSAEKLASLMTPPAVPVVEVPKAAAAKQMTEEEALTAFPRIGSIVAAAEAREKAQKTELVGQLKTAQTAFTEAELNEKSIGELTKLATLAKVDTVDYSGIGVARVPTVKDAEIYAPPPDAFAADLKTLQEATKH